MKPCIPFTGIVPSIKAEIDETKFRRIVVRPHPLCADPTRYGTLRDPPRPISHHRLQLRQIASARPLVGPLSACVKSVFILDSYCPRFDSSDCVLVRRVLLAFPRKLSRPAIQGPAILRWLPFILSGIRVLLFLVAWLVYVVTTP